MADSGIINAARPWIKNYPPGVPAELDPASPRTVTEILQHTFEAYPAFPAFESFGKAISFRQLQAASGAVTAWLQSKGCRKGDRIAIMMPNVVAYPIVMFGALLGGYTIVNINPLYTAREVCHQVKDSGASVLFVVENFAPVIEEARSVLGLKEIIVCGVGDGLGLKGALVNFAARRIKKVVPPYSLPGAVALKTVLATRGPGTPVTVLPDDIAFLQYTGGTTGVAKGATLLHRNIAANVGQVSAWISPFLAKRDRHAMITALPLYHIFALTCCCLAPMQMGGCCVLIANPRDIGGLVKTLKSTRFSMISGVNTLYNALLNHPGFADVDFSTLDFCTAGGMATQHAVARKWKAVTGKAIIEGYGLSETSPVATINPMTLDEFSGTIGYPLPSTDIMIRSIDGHILPPGEPGEICIKGPQVMAGYWNRAEDTAKVMTEDGYFCTGDVGIELPNGQFKIVDRMKDMVLVSGFNVYPNEVEDVIAAHPGVLEVAVVGLPDEDSGEAVTAFVVRKDPELTAETLRSFARQGLTAYKVPKRIIFRDSLPKTNVGKVLRRELRDEARMDRTRVSAPAA